MSVAVDGERSRKWVAFAKQKLRMLKDLGLTAKTYFVDGYRIKLQSIGGLEKAHIIAPPGAVVVDKTALGYEYRYADQYGGDFAWVSLIQPSNGFVPLTLFSAAGDLIYMATGDYAEPYAQAYTWLGRGTRRVRTL